MIARVAPGAKEHLSMGQRFGEVVSVAVLLALLAFFRNHMTMQTGFFTSTFGTWEQLSLFVPLIASLAAPMVRAVVGWRNPGRPFEIVTYLLEAIGSFWLLRIFPFDFTHLGDALPNGLHFLLAWVPDWLGRAALVLQVALSLVMVVVTTWQFTAARTQR